MRRRPLLACLCVAAAFTHAAAETIAVKAKLLIDGTGGPPRKDPVVIVQEGKIFAIGTLVPTGATLIDLGDRTLLPGFIDCHVHLVGRSIGEGTNWEDAAVRDLPQEDAIRGVRNAQRTLAAGFTTVRNVGAEDFGDIALRNAIRDGVVPGPRIIAAGHSIGITGGHCDTNGYAPGLLPSDPLHGVPVVEASTLRIEAEVRHVRLGDDQAPGIEAEVERSGRRQTPHHQQAGRHERHGHAHLCDHEERLRPGSARTARRRAPVGFQRVG